MNESIKSLVVGFVIGFAVAGVGAYFLLDRYEISNSGPNGMLQTRIDKWTGKTWMYQYHEQNGQKIWQWNEMREGR